MKWSFTVLTALIMCSAGCSNDCKNLAEKVCERAGGNVIACESMKDGTQAAKNCVRLKSVAASCKVLERLANEATDDEQAACQADLALLRALEKQKM
ncbi:MAG TPA: hypothetical protein EYN06_08205 [Myxococcales bacterium]|nr:hypothetical protein [Myxococcales bacterium]